MKTLFSVYADTGNHDRVMFFDATAGFLGRDIIRLSFICTERLRRYSDYDDFVVATDNPAHMLALMYAGWVLGKNIVQPNTLQPEGFRVFDAKCTLCVFSEEGIFTDAENHFRNEDGAYGINSPALLDLSGIFGKYRSECLCGPRYSSPAEAPLACQKTEESEKENDYETVAGSVRDILDDVSLRETVCSCTETYAAPDGQKKNIKISDSDFCQSVDRFIDCLSPFVKDRNAEEKLTITGLTSGSTGLPKRVPRTLGDFYREIECVRNFILPSYADNTVGAATVTNFHAYGVLFRFLLPVISEIPVYVSMLEYQEQFMNLRGLSRNLFLISNPGFFKRLDDTVCPVRVNLMMSAGGRLTAPVFRKAKAVYDAPLLEIYGSTETGVMAYRYPENTEEEWLVPSVSRVETVDEEGNAAGDTGLVRITSAHVNGGVPYTGSDVIRLSENSCGRQSFTLLGRSDRIIKLEDNRVSLDELEKIITAHEFIRECAVVKFEQKGREFIGAMLVLSDTGRRELSSVTHGRFFIRLRNELGRVMIKLTVPRRFIITDELPLTDSRKIAYKKVERAFYHESA